MLTFIDNLLNRITMYRLMFYYLIALIAIAAIFGVFGILPYSAPSIIVSMFLFIAACSAVNWTLAKIFKVPTNFESAYITAFILTLIITPISFDASGKGLALSFGAGLIFLVCASVFAMASKYILAINRKHIFNPAAIAVVLTAFILGQYASWWAGGNLPLLAFVVISGLLVVRKIQRFDLVISFVVAALASIILTNLSYDPLVTIQKAFVHTSLLFVAFVMITEPLTTPPTRGLRIAYGAIVGALFSPLVHVGPIYSTPELALVVGNIFSYAVSPKIKYALTFREKKEIGTDTYDFTFNEKIMKFSPGQYMEFTLPDNGADGRGNRRYFTIASSPTESEFHLGVKFYGDAASGVGSSTFKKKMLALQPGDRMMAGQLAGDFTLPRDFDKKLVFLAGGIGITPFRSMIKYLSDRAGEKAGGKQPDLVLLYSNRTPAEIAYREVFDEAARTIGLKTVYVNTATDGRLDAARIEREVPDYRERMFYISGTRAMVVTFEKALHDLGIPRTHIKTDFFPGFA
jgi:glycine betaine catabolism B